MSNKQETKKRENWMKPRHKVVTALLRPIVSLLAKRYHIKIDRFAQQGERNWLILANHQTDFDQFFVGLAFRGPLYYVAMEDLFSNGWVSRLIKYLVAPIPFKKASADLRAVMNCIRLAKEGGSIALFPEGNRTYSGHSCYINPSVASMAKKMGLPIAIFRIEGGYGIKPRWADTIRHGHMRAGVRRVIEPEEYQALSKEELYELLCKELWVDERTDDALYHGKALAEGLERALYVCPDCGLSAFDTHGDIMTCRRCGKQYRYLPNKQFQALSGESRFRYVADWYDYQEDYIRQLDLSAYADTVLYQDTVDLCEVIVYDRKRPVLRHVPLALLTDRLDLDDGKMILPYADIKAMACIADHKLNIFYQDTIYQVQGDVHFNALKYCNIYYHAIYRKEEHSDGEFQFLGL